jgi:hypothetical protein
MPTTQNAPMTGKASAMPDNIENLERMWRSWRSCGRAPVVGHDEMPLSAHAPWPDRTPNVGSYAAAATD